MYRVKNAKERPKGELSLPVLMDLIKQEMRVFKSLAETVHEGPEVSDTVNLEFLRETTISVTDKCQGFLNQIADHLGMTDSN